MPSKSFRIGLVFTPSSVVSVGVLNSNQKEAYRFMEKIQPLIDDFMNRVREENDRGRSNPDKNVSLTAG
jgi:hypothetical protein